VSEPSVDDLRRDLRERGYLSHAIERWFAHDPWSSRAFWLELITVAGKAALVIAVFAIVPLVSIMLFRNHPLSVVETLLLSLLYGLTAFGVSFLLLVSIALILKVRPTIVLDTPRALLGISFAAAALLASPIAMWWYRFPTTPRWPELLTGVAGMATFFVIATIAISAALLSFSIYELRRIPAIHQRPRGVPMTIAASVVIALLFLPGIIAQDGRAAEQAPLQVVTTPGRNVVTLIAVDGLTWELAHERLLRPGRFAAVVPVASITAGSATERWATLGTGVPPATHGVRAVEGVRLRQGRHLLQAVSSLDFVLRDLAPVLRLASREPLPPTVRRRDYVWEIFARRSVASLSVNWWTTDDVDSGALHEVSQQPIFSAARTPAASAESQAVRVDEMAALQLIRERRRQRPRFATTYLPALDIILNRLSLDPATQLAASVRSLENLDRTIAQIDGEVIVIGMPGDAQRGSGVIASTVPLDRRPRSAYDLAPTLCTLLGFPASAEMPGRSLIGNAPRIATYGSRVTTTEPVRLNDDYYENLRSLGYIR